MPRRPGKGSAIDLSTCISQKHVKHVAGVMTDAIVFRSWGVSLSPTSSARQKPFNVNCCCNQPLAAHEQDLCNLLSNEQFQVIEPETSE